MSRLFYSFKQLKSQWLTSLLLIVAIALATVFLGALITLTQNRRDMFQEQKKSIEAREIKVIQFKDDFSQFGYGDNPVWIVRLPPEKKKVILDQKVLQELKNEAPAVENAYIKKREFLFDPKMDDPEQMLGISRSFLETLQYKMLDGSMPSKKDFAERRKVVVLTEYMAQKKFKDKKAIGKTLIDYKVIGVFKPLEQQKGYLSNFSNKDFEYGASGLIPAGANSRSKQKSERELFFIAKPGQLKEAKAQLSTAVQKRWGVQVNTVDQFARNREFETEFQQRSLAMAILGVGGILVASLCTLHLLLARVMTRQRQLAIARTLGATRVSLAGQVLSEVLVFGLIGGALGIAITLGLVQWLNNNTESKSPFAQVGFDPLTMLLLLLGILVILLFFAFIPAVQAAKVKPAEVLRA